MKTDRILFALVLIVGIWVAGCSVNDEGKPFANRPPTTALTIAPREGDTVNHYINISWSANDPDGDIAGFKILVDGEQVSFTQALDSTIAFSSTTNSDTAFGPVSPHSFSVIAVDKEGQQDTLPPVRHFWVHNIAPIANFAPSGTPADGETIGHGFRVTLTGSDLNRSIMYFSISLHDENHWTAWSSDSAYLFMSPDLIIQTAYIPAGVNVMSNEALVDSQLTVFARVKDAGDAVSLSVTSRRFLVKSYLAQPPDTTFFKPTMGTITATYGSASFYPDGSIYQQINTETKIAFVASSALYRGEINAYRYQKGDSAWSDWIKTPTLTYGDLSVGEYPFKLTARDIAGAQGDTASYFIRIVNQQSTDSIIIVAETRSGNGSPASPTDLTVNAYYERIFEGFKFRTIRYADTSRPGQYISPYDLHNAGVVMWHADDRADFRLGDNILILRQFANHGGRIMLSGWDVMSALEDGTLDSNTYAHTASTTDPNGFAYDILKLFSAHRSRPRTTTGFITFPDSVFVPIDATKLTGGMIDRCWIFDPHGECHILGLLATRDSTANPYYKKPTVYLYDQSFRVLVFGLPLYFCEETPVKTYIASLVPRMQLGLPN